VYASLGRAQREPARLDLLSGEDNATVPHDLEAVRPEKVIDLETGVDVRTPRLALQANLYAMEFEDEIALTGELSMTGLPLRRNVDDSYRRGLELDLKWQAAPGWTVLHSANVSRNRIDAWTQYYDVYDPQGDLVDSQPVTYRDVEPLLTPEYVGNLGVEWSHRDLSVVLTGRYVAESRLDNTGSAGQVLPSHTNLDLRVSTRLGKTGAKLRPRITLHVDNLLDNEDAFGGGYSYTFINRDAGGNDSIDGIPYYYPLATRNAILSLTLDY
jgi:iron complex outermembrane receptor protein